MDAEKLKERLDLFKATIRCEKTDRVPMLGNAWAWKILDSDLQPKPTFQEATSNWDIMEKIVREHFGRYPFDSHIEVGFRFNSSFQPVLKGKIRHTADEEHGAQALDSAPMQPDEYDKLIEMGPEMFEYTTLFPRMFDNLTLEELQELIRLNGAFGQFVGKMYGALVSDYSCPISAPVPIEPPLEDVFNYYRGIKGLALDLRKQPDKVLAYVESRMDAILAKLEKQLDADDSACICSYSIPFLAPTIMNKKQFEKFYYPSLKAMLDLTRKKGKRVYMFIEGETKRFVPYLKEYEDMLLIQVENDNIFELKKELPHVCIAGGMPVELLNSGTKEECIAYAKRLCDELGGTGYVFSTDKMMAYECDGKRENLLAVLDFVANYRI